VRCNWIPRYCGIETCCSVAASCPASTGYACICHPEQTYSAGLSNNAAAAPIPGSSAGLTLLLPQYHPASTPRSASCTKYVDPTLQQCWTQTTAWTTYIQTDMFAARRPQPIEVTAMAAMAAWASNTAGYISSWAHIRASKA
jgi:hypothetical protein